MNTRSIGSLAVSEVGVGCNNFGSRLSQEQATAVVDAAIESGVNFFDTADIYGATTSEVLLGRALKGRRDRVVVATKFGMPIDDTHFGAKPAYVRSACEDSLRRLDTDYIDIYQLHYPDDTTPLADTLGALGELVTAGKVREIGCSNFSAAQLREAAAAAGTGRAFASVQNQYSLLERTPETDGVLATCDELGIGFLPFYPLANGLLTGKVRPGEAIPEGTRLATMSPERSAHWLSDQLRARVNSLLEYADATNTTILTFAFSWLLRHPEVSSVIAGASSPDQVRANAHAASGISDSQFEELNRLSDPES
ncbi:MAG TPA: aldo/keto reductase [Acidimicrobiales bacterium]|nr:aldo/keto reductase [Acidimicrobiales bacterium]